LSAGSVLFKVCIVGDQIRVAQRFSLPDVQEGEDICSGVIPFQRMSSVATADEADLDPQAAGKDPCFTPLSWVHLSVNCRVTQCMKVSRSNLKNL
jgi:hypothetical protein